MVSGSQARTRVPPEGGQTISVRPPSSSARSRIDRSPTPATTSGSMPAPSSPTSTSSEPAPPVRRTAALRARAWRAVLVSASDAIRYAATSTAADSGGTSSAATVTARSALLIRSACWSQGREQAEVVEGRRPQPVHQAAYVGQRVGDVLARLRDQAARGLRVAVERVAGRVEPHRDAAEHRAEPVVQVAPDPAPVLLARQHQLLAGLLEVVGQPGAAHRHRRLAHDVEEQRLVALATASTARPRAGSSSRPTSSSPYRIGTSRTSRGCRPWVARDGAAAVAEDLDPHVVELERRRHGDGQRRQLVAHVAGLLEPGGQVGDDGVAVAAAADQQPADDRGEPATAAGA